MQAWIRWKVLQDLGTAWVTLTIRSVYCISVEREVAGTEALA